MTLAALRLPAKPDPDFPTLPDADSYANIAEVDTAAHDCELNLAIIESGNDSYALDPELVERVRRYKRRLSRLRARRDELLKEYGSAAE